MNVETTGLFIGDIEHIEEESKILKNDLTFVTVI